MEATARVELGQGVEAKVQFRPKESGRRVVTGIVITGSPDSPITARMLHSLHLGQLEEEANAVPPPPPPMAKPDRGRMTPVEFSRCVADHWHYYASFSSKPGKHLAEVFGVPVPTAHNWIREARLRGMIPEATRRGRAAR